MARRRAQGDGSIYQAADGRWRASINLGWQNGKRRRKQLSGKTRAEVAAKLKQALKEQDGGRDLGLESITVGAFLRRWLDLVVVPNRKPSTTASYEQVVRLYLVPQIGDVRLERLSPEQIQAMLRALLKTGLSPRTVSYTRSILRVALKQAMKWGHLGRNPVDATDAPKAQAHKIVPLTEAQARSILHVVTGHRLEALYRLALSFGLRRGEALGLLWSDVDLDAGTVRITGQVQYIRGPGRGGKVRRTSSPKTKSGARTIYLPEQLVAAMQRHWEAQAKERRVEGVEWHEHGLVFPSERGTPMAPRNLVRHWKSVLVKAGLPATVRFHDLRHSAATIMLMQGIPLKTVSDVLGHSSIRVTADVYGHSTSGDKRAAAERMTQLLG
jgi:integrase